MILYLNYNDGWHKEVCYNLWLSYCVFGAFSNNLDTWPGSGFPLPPQHQKTTQHKLGLLPRSFFPFSSHSLAYGLAILSTPTLTFYNVSWSPHASVWWNNKQTNSSFLTLHPGNRIFQNQWTIRTTFVFESQWGILVTALAT